ncbi:MAG: Ig-like domain-containing protein [Thaumarchaeota archaeon]|nr:Ig-like domain-containing protein [Nitrososphaerota archaeon]
MTIKSYEDQGTFGIRLIPNNMVENSLGILEVYPLYGGHVFPTPIENLAYSSTNSNIIQVIGEKQNSTGFSTELMVKANNPGKANIVLAAPGFTPEQYPITVYTDKISPSSIIIKAVPQAFSLGGPKNGYFSVELTNKDGLPVTSQNDLPVTIVSTNDKILMPHTSQLTIKKGQYYAEGQFSTGQPGSARLLASASSFQVSNATISVSASNTPIIQAYVYPSVINNFQTSTAFVIAQLRDKTGSEILANEDIPISIMVSNSTTTGLVNTSPQNQLISANTPLVIKKGDYEGYAPIQVEAGLNGTFNIGLSAPAGYLVSNHTAAPADCVEISGCVVPSTTTLESVPVQLTTETSQILDDKSAKLDLVPMLATGKKELIGVMHLEDPYGKPVIANKDIQIEVDSSEPNYLSVDPVDISQGQAATPVFGTLSNTAPPSSSVSDGLPSLVQLHVITYKDTTVSAAINASSTNSFNLVATPLVSKILSQSSFPIALYLTDPSNTLTYFPNSYNPTILPNDNFQVKSQKIAEGDSVEVLNATAVHDGSSTLQIIAGNYPTNLQLASVSSSPAKADLDYSSPLFANFTNLMSVQVLDSNSNPRYLDKNMSIKLISSNDSIIQMPSNVTISKDTYYSTFDVMPRMPGIVTISVVANNLPLETYPVNIDTLVPDASINATKSVLPSETFFATLKVEKYGKPLPNMSVNWKVSGGKIQTADKTTNRFGIANIALLSDPNGTINLDPSVSGHGFNPTTVKEIVRINSTSSFPNMTKDTTKSSNTPTNKLFRIHGVDPLPFVVLGSIAVGGLMMKKKTIFRSKKNKQPGIPTNK